MIFDIFWPMAERVCGTPADARAKRMCYAKEGGRQVFARALEGNRRDVVVVVVVVVMAAMVVVNGARGGEWRRWQTSQESRAWVMNEVVDVGMRRLSESVCEWMGCLGGYQTV